MTVHLIPRKKLSGLFRPFLWSKAPFEPLAPDEMLEWLTTRKAMFFSENDALGEQIDYEAVVSGTLQLVSASAAIEARANGLKV